MKQVIHTNRTLLSHWIAKPPNYTLYSTDSVNLTFSLHCQHWSTVTKPQYSITPVSVFIVISYGE